MRVALKKLEEVEAYFGLTVRLEYLSTKEIKLADALSRGDMEAAKECLSSQGVGLKEFDVESPIGGRPFAVFAIESEAEVCGALSAEDLEVEG
jgi:hypothetical protein